MNPYEITEQLETFAEELALATKNVSFDNKPNFFRTLLKITEDVRSLEGNYCQMLEGYE